MNERHTDGRTERCSHPGWRFLHRRRAGLCLAFGLSLAATTTWLACTAKSAEGESPGKAAGKAGGGARREVVPVLAADVVRKETPVQLSAVGAVEPYSTVMVKAQVGGLLTRVHFKEGQDVRRGDLLFTIDSAPYEATLHQKEADSAKSAIEARNAEVDNQRYSDLVTKRVVSQEESDKARTAAESTAAQARSDKAAVEYARLQLSYCSIHAPIDARAGSLMINEGNLVKANDSTPLVVINQIQPVYVSFAVPERELAAIKRRLAEGRTLKTRAVMPGDEERSVEGDLTFLNNEVDRQTGTIRLRSTFANEDKRLWPGQFVSVTLVLDTEPNAVVVPSEAVQTGQKGTYVFVVKPGAGENASAMVVEHRPVTVGRSLDGETVIAKGLEAGEKVVTDGHLRLTPGAKVEIKSGLGNGKTAAEESQSRAAVP
jgi:multidrug efflux system membrane fusion protein